MFLAVGALMQTIDTVFQRELKRLIAHRILDLKDNLSVNSYENVADFKYLMGKIAALNDMEDMIEIAQDASDQRNR
jgi:CRISPR/Cas system type I-B associated protein Csh2 (Cas7 group RAMP superfamily)